MARFVPWCCMVRHFIGAKSGLLRQLLSDLEETGCFIFVRRDQLSLRIEIGKSRALLDGELIKRHMPLLLVDRAGKLAAPVLRRLLRPRIDEIEGDAREDPRRQPESRQGFAGSVLPAERFEVRILERLYPN